MLSDDDVLDENVEIVSVLDAPPYDPDKPFKKFRFKTPPKIQNGLVLINHWDGEPPKLGSDVILEDEIELINISGPGSVPARNTRTVPIPHRALRAGESWVRDFMSGWVVQKASDIPASPVMEKLDQILAELAEIKRLVM